MEDLKNASLGTLVDLLAKYTEDVMRMLRDGGYGDDYEVAKAKVKLISAEIERRKRS
ncbi:hypothetical protein MKQ68_11645 [Chitinophaga horti]|uniref:Uncharacterized protein n=1 Tax=Chitinophaga horti TaxID=2920382 RepID=A0ABY6J8E5_9BACT|nr:hypothetical protein [Chitinophaga horti]UYQ95755.1 hypothetical protein MKQ68_11645 [Chitinophaga horti]